MKQHISRIYNNPLISGSSIILLGSFLANLVNFLFNQQMVSRLPLDQYGVLALLLAFINLPGFAFSFLNLIIVSYTGGMFVKQELGKVKGFFVTIYSFALPVIFLLFILSTLSLPALKSFFHITSTPLLILALLIIVVSSLSVINQAFLQARLSFFYLTSINFMSAVMKFCFTLGAFLLGWGLEGVAYGILFAFLIAYLLTFIPMSFLRTHPKELHEIHPANLLSYSWQSAVSLVALTAFISTDLFLVKHFFSANQAGLYAGLTFLGRVIFFFSGPIASAMFPIIVQKQEKGERYINTYWLALMLVTGFSIAIASFYAIYPQFIISLFLRRSAYLAITSLVGYYALVMVVYTMLSTTVNLYLSIKRTSVWMVLLLGAILQAILLYSFHRSFFQIITINLLVEAIVLIFLLIQLKLTEHGKSSL